MSAKPFEVGLVLAGAISADAYTAGVIDFLLQALEAWEAAKAAQKNGGAKTVPDHEVRLRAAAGSSAGAMTAAILVRALATKIVAAAETPNLPDDGALAADPSAQTAPFQNPFAAAWVQSIDIKHLLAIRDLEGEENRNKPVASILDSSVLGHIGTNVLRVDQGDVRQGLPNYVSDPFDVFLTITNLRGVPYALKLLGQASGYRHMMTMHAGHMCFALAATAPTPEIPSVVWLDPTNVGAANSWQTMMKAAVASGAFPVGLAPRLLTRHPDSYSDPDWRIRDQAGTLVKAPATDPAWPQGFNANGDEYSYWNVDGGLMNNEPLELVRTVLAQGGRNERDGLKATRAVVMVDPFPNTTSVTTSNDASLSIFDVIIQMFGALKEQARFKPEELALANDPNTFSRYIVTPIYVGKGAKTEPAIASAIMGGFGGFLAEDFRRGIVTAFATCVSGGSSVAKAMKKISYSGYRFPPEIIHRAIWLYLRFTLSPRDVEDLLAERGITVSYESIRRWVNHFAADRSRLTPGPTQAPHDLAFG